MSTFTAAPTTSAYALDDSLTQPTTHRPGLSAAVVLAGDILGVGLILWTLWSTVIAGRYAGPGDWSRWSLLLPTFLVLYCSWDAYPGVERQPSN